MALHPAHDFSSEPQNASHKLFLWPRLVNSGVFNTVSYSVFSYLSSGLRLRGTLERTLAR
jgi:hypothetical protein